MKMTKVDLESPRKGFEDVDEFQVQDVLELKATLLGDEKTVGLLVQSGDAVARLSMSEVIKLKNSVDSFLDVFRGGKMRSMDNLISKLIQGAGVNADAKIVGAANEEEMQEKIAQLKKENPGGEILQIDMNKIMKSDNPGKAIKEAILENMQGENGECMCPKCVARRKDEAVGQHAGDPSFSIDKNWNVDAKGETEH